MPKRYSPEIRRTALEFVNQGQTQIEVAQALGVNPKTLSHWVTTAQARMPEQQRNELEELKRLRLQVRQQQAEIDFLKKTESFSEVAACKTHRGGKDAAGRYACSSRRSVCRFRRHSERRSELGTNFQYALATDREGAQHL